MTNGNDPADMPTMADSLSIKTDCWCKRLTKREWYAGLAMQFMALRDEQFTKHWKEDIAENAVGLADALIAALNREGTKC